MACLLYCVTQPNSEAKPTIGVCDTAVQSREMLGARLYWSELADPQACLAEAEALKKSAVESTKLLDIGGKLTPIPFGFPTMSRSDEVFEQHLAPEQELYREALERVQNAVQYEVVGTWADEQQEDRSQPVKRTRVSRAAKADLGQGCRS